VVVAPITTSIHPVESHLPLGPEEGLPRPSAANCDNLQAVEKGLIDTRRVGRLPPFKIPELDAALRFALQIR
jgi:mRNA-degrading endonuclease toxin of MazEF toxin-antitoxin module